MNDTLPSLNGSEKQIAWAEKIRQQLIGSVAGWAEKLARAKGERELLAASAGEIADCEALLAGAQRVAAWASRQTSAKALINATQSDRRISLQALASPTLEVEDYDLSEEDLALRAELAP